LRKIDKSRTFTQGSEYELPQNLFAYRRIEADRSVLGLMGQINSGDRVFISNKNYGRHQAKMWRNKK
jgi:hypothetical protein